MKTTPYLIPYFQKATGCNIVYYPKPVCAPLIGKLSSVVFEEETNTVWFKLENFTGKDITLTEPLDWLETKIVNDNIEIFKFLQWRLIIIDAPLWIDEVV